MKQSGKAALCGMLAALGTVLMLAAYFPFLTYAVPAAAGILLIVAVVEAGVPWAFGAYAVTAVLVFLLAESEAKLLYIAFFGYYPVLKSLLERPRSRLVEWLCKLLCFNAAMLAAYGLFAALLGVSLEEFGAWGVWGAAALLAVGNLVFCVYDLAVTRLAQLYLVRLHPAIRRMTRQK